MEGNGRNLGDIYTSGQDPLEKYYDMVRQGVNLTRKKWMVKPSWSPPRVPGMEGLQKVFEDHMLPRNWELLVDLWTKLQCGTYFVKRPNWLEPPITAICIDERTEDCVVVAGGTAGSGDVPLVTFEVPDRHIGTIVAFGNALQNPANFGQIIWRIKINKKEVRCYGTKRTGGGFKLQLGTLTNPTRFPNPIRLKYKDLVEVTAAAPAGVTACAFTRITGWYWPATKLTQDGSFGEYHTL